MIVPAHWVEGRLQQTIDGRPVTVRRWGWSDDCAEAAQAHADARTHEAFERIAAGEKLTRRERKQAYNGADGMPIREEIVSRHGDAVVTRNSYGARCLNTPDVLFADIDFVTPLRGGVLGYALGPAVIAGLVSGYTGKTWIGGVLAALVVFVVAWRLGLKLKRGQGAPNPGSEKRAGARIARFIQQHPDWHLRIYRTPAGLRLLAMHDTFQASDAAALDCFERLGVDTVYARMCRNQTAFAPASRPSPGASAWANRCARAPACGRWPPTNCRSAKPGWRATSRPPKAMRPASSCRQSAAPRCTRRRWRCSRCMMKRAGR